MSNADEGAALSWLHPTTARPLVAALIEDAPRLPQVDIEIATPCAFCGNPIERHRTRFRWKGPRKGVLEITIVPICPTCARRHDEDPDYYREALKDLRRPDLRLVSRDGRTDGIPRGRLSLVRDDESGDEPDDEL
ncbi:MAG: hypothetical protein K8H88_13085 [Sandaracinaceae bacterium]|nr:hypothetical protein [Sandaracinaceae bacterium]